MKTKLLSTILLVFVALNMNAQSPNWQWALRAGGTSTEYAESTLDANGNIYVSGAFFSPTITFGTTTLSNAGGADMFIAKYDASGNVIWAKSAGGASVDAAQNIATDANGNVYITGLFYSGSITFGTTTLTNAGSNTDIFIVKYDASGNVIWAKRAGSGTNGDDGKGIAVDVVTGNIFITGYFGGTANFDALSITSAGNNDIFIAKYDANGNAIWVKQAGDAPTIDEWGNSISVDASSNCYVTGQIGNGAGDLNVFISKYDNSGNMLWTKTSGGTSQDEGNGISVSTNGNSYTTGYFRSPTITFGSTTLTSSSAGAHPNIFVVKYDGSGNFLWAKSAGGDNDDLGAGISADVNGNAYITGMFGSSTLTFGSSTLTSAGGTFLDAFVAKYDASGNPLWAKSVGGVADDYGQSIYAAPNGSTFVTGIFGSNTIVFDTTTLTNANTDSTSDIFVAKLDSALGINEPNNLIDTVRVFPNPFSTQTTFQTDVLLNNATLTVYNSLGQTIKQIKNISGQTVVLSRDNLASGLYFIRITEGNKVITAKKLVITD